MKTSRYILPLLAVLFIASCTHPSKRQVTDDTERMLTFVKSILYDNYGDFIDEDIECDELATLPYNYDFGIDRVEYDYDPPYLPDERIVIDYLSAGNKVELPSDFVTKITVRMEEIYD